MKWFYLISLAAVGGLVALPFWLLDPQPPGRFAGRIVQFNTYGAKIKSIDPPTCGDTSSASIQGNIYEGLYCYHYLKRPLEVIPQLAAAMPEISADGKTYTIRLKKNVKYARNPCFGPDPTGEHTWATRTVRAEDFVLAFKRIGDFHITANLTLAFLEDKILDLKVYRNRTRAYKKGDFARYDAEALRGVEAVDEHTLRIRLAVPFPQFLYVLAMNTLAPIPRETIDYYLASRPARAGRREPIPLDERDPEIRASAAAVGTGPYVLTEWMKGTRIVLERNAEFRGEPYPSEGAPGDAEAGLLADAGKPTPFIDVLHLEFVKENNTAWMMFEQKRRDVAGIPRDVYTKVISPTKDLMARWRQQGVRLVKDTYPAVYWIVFNMSDRVVGRSKSLRQGLSLGFNVEQYIETLHNGRGIRALNAIPSTFRGHAEAGPSPYAKYDPVAAEAKMAAARKELIAAGVIKGGDPLPTLTLDIGGRDEDARRLGTFIQGQFRRLGVTLKVELNDWPTLQKKVDNKQCQMYSMGWHADYPDAENFLQLYYSPNIKRGTNNSNYSNKEFDQLFAAAAVIPQEDKRIPLYVRMTRMISEDCPVLLLSEPISYMLVNQWVTNVKPHPIGYGFSKFRRIDPVLRRRMGGR